MKQITRKSTLALLLVLGTFSSLLAQQFTNNRSEATIADAVATTDTFSTLLAALSAADLVETLGTSGPFTVFAPTDAAFKALPKGTVETLLEPKNKDQLIAVLTYHVVSGEVLARQAAQVRFADSLNGQRLQVTFGNGQLQINESRVTQPDLLFSNGVVHVIDQVLLPESKNVVEVAQGAGIFQTLLAAATEAGLAETLATTKPITVLAPTDEAFGQLPAGTVESLLQPENRSTLIELLSYHVIPGRVYSDQLLASNAFGTLASSEVPVGIREGRIQVGNAAIQSADLETANGVIHVVDAVLLPNETGSMAQAPEAVIRKAIEMGVPLFNMGQHRACADIYELASFAILKMDSGSLPAKAKLRLRQGLDRASQMNNAGQRAWEIRYAFDDVLAMMNP